MKLTDLNEYIQTAAAVGAIFALIAVGYEIRESNRIATQQAISSNWSNWIEYAGNTVDAGISTTVAKSMTRPDELTLDEKIDLDSYLQKFIFAYHHDYIVLLYDKDTELPSLILQELAGDVPKMFGSRFSRAWFAENKIWMESNIASVIEQGIKRTTIGSDLDYYDRIDTLAANLE